MHCLSLQHQYHMCVKSVTVQTYCNYYAFTLKQLIEKRRKDDIRFTSNEVFYVAKNLL